MANKRKTVPKATIAATSIIATIGVILIALGVIWMVASNWHTIPNAIKILILAAVTGLAYASGYKLESAYPKIAQTLFMLTAILWTVSLFLIAQIYNLPTTFQANANILAVTLIGTAALAYIINSPPVLTVAIFSFAAWALLQAWAATEIIPELTKLWYHFVTLSELSVAGVLFGLGLLHRSFGKDEFARVYTYWSAFSMLSIGFSLTHQFSQQQVPGFWFLPTIAILTLLSIPALTLIAGVLSLKKTRISKFDVWSGLITWISYVIGISIFPIILGLEYQETFYETLWHMPTPYIIQWLLFNALFVTLVLLVINFGTRERRTALVHLGMLFFIAYIIARYVGFIMDLSGYLAISTLFIIGGIGLIILAIGLTKFHKITVEKLK